MQYIENRVPQDFAKLCFKGMYVPICELTEEEFSRCLADNDNQNKSGNKGTMVLPVPDIKTDIGEKPISELGLSQRPANCLLRAGVRTIGELCLMTEAEVGLIKNMGVKSLEEIKSVLAMSGMELKATDA